MALFFLVRGATWATGCSSGPADGADGGKCKDNGCTQTCDPGLTCEGNTCHPSDSSGSYSGGSSSPYYCSESYSPSCGDTQTAFACVGGAIPSPTFICGVVSIGSDGDTYCCDARDASTSDGDASASTDAGGDSASDDASDGDASGD